MILFWYIHVMMYACILLRFKNCHKVALHGVYKCKCNNHNLLYRHVFHTLFYYCTAANYVVVALRYKSNIVWP